MRITTDTTARAAAHDPEAPTYSCPTIDQAVSEARSALAVCTMTHEQREDCKRTLEVVSEVLASEDHRFEITPVPEPELGCTHVVRMVGRQSGRVAEQFTTDNPYGAVEAYREAQAYTLEERFDLYAERGW